VSGQFGLWDAGAAPEREAEPLRNKMRLPEIGDMVRPLFERSGEPIARHFGEVYQVWKKGKPRDRRPGAPPDDGHRLTECRIDGYHWAYPWFLLEYEDGGKA
jgi:hypothetical protein